MVITLIGYRGSGKTAVARPLADRIGWDWIDADVELERLAGMSIREIFEAESEAGFRKREAAILEELFARDRLVVAAGGGAVLNADTRRRMREAGPVVWLKASVDLLERRIREDATTAARRPNLTNAGGRAEIESLLNQRAPLYAECASAVVETDGLMVNDVVAQILSQIEKSIGGGLRA